MARHRRALILLSAAFIACGSPKPPPAPAPQAVVVVDAGPPPIEDAGAPTPPPPIPRLDCALKPSDISEDESPTFKGVARSERLFDWLAARGVSNADTIKWYAEHVSHIKDPERADIAIGEAPCFGFTIGKEEAIVCAISSSFEGERFVNAVGVVVRLKKPVVVLDTGIAFGVGQHRIPDLQIAFAPDMRSFELRDRSSSPAHIVRLVEPPSKCAERQQVLDECAARLASGKGDTSLCPIVVDPSGQKRLEAPKAPPYELSGDCTLRMHDVESLYAVATLPDAEPALMVDAKRAIDFVKRSCAARGTWKWTGLRYAK